MAVTGFQFGDKDTPFVIERDNKPHPITRERIEEYVENNGADIIADVLKEHLGFAGYLMSCDVTCRKMCGLSIYDMPDQTWRDWYDEEVRPLDAVKMTLCNAMEQ